MASLLGRLLVVVATVAVTGAVQNEINMTSPGGLALSSTAQVSIARIGGPAVADAVVDLISQSCIFAEDNLFLRRVAFVETRDGTSGATYGQLGYYGGIWQVDEAMFLKTQADTAALRAKYSAIQAAFGIDWKALQWRDLEKPIYSGLAAALYIFTQGTVPTNLEQQGTFIHDHYHARNTAFNYTRQIKELPGCDHDQRIDIAFLLDAATSNDDFSRMRGFVEEVLDSHLTYDSLHPTGNVRVAVYQFGYPAGGVHGAEVVKSITMTNFTDQKLMLTNVRALQQVVVSHQGSLDVGQAVSKVVADAFSTDHRALSAKMVILVTDKGSLSPADMIAYQTAGQNALREGVSVLGVGVGAHVDKTKMEQLVTSPSCRHFLSVPDFRDLQYFTQLVQRTICNEPMIARGMVHCHIGECRNVAFPITGATTTLITNVTCGDGKVFVTSRMPRPGRGFDDFHSHVDAVSGPAYVTLYDRHVGHDGLLYALFFRPGTADPSCVATLSTVNGVVGPPKEEKCEAEWPYPTVNPCKTNVQNKTRFPYDRNQAMFIQCDLQNNMYLTKCPPGDTYYSAACEVCVGGPDSPALAGCENSVQGPGDSGPLCGLRDNPCTQANVLAGSFYFACPADERHYLQCNIWGHAYVRPCQEHAVWRQDALTCEFENTVYNPCGAPGVRFYAYPADPHLYVDCGANMVPNIMHCQLNLVWDAAQDTCNYPPKPTIPADVTHITQRVTLPVTQHVTSGGGGVVVTPVPGSGLVGTNFAAPCTRDRVDAQQLYWPYPNHPSQYIQCDLWGDSFVRSCQRGFTYDEISHTCVNGLLHPENHFTQGPAIG